MFVWLEIGKNNINSWSGDYDIDKKNMVGSIVAQLRNKLERYQVQTKFIYNVPNKGYRFVVQEN